MSEQTIRGWVVKYGEGYEVNERCGASSRWCCLRRHARIHLTLDSARAARDAVIAAALREVDSTLPSFLVKVVRDALVDQHKVFRLIVPNSNPRPSILVRNAPLSDEEVDRLFVFAFDLSRAPTEAEAQSIRDVCARFLHLRGRRGLPKAHA